jgi:hypothetical protein
MSIKVGFLNTNYDPQYLTNNNNTLVLNSITNSNIIMINADNAESENMFINYQNKFITGLSSNTYIFRANNDNIITLNQSNISLYQSTNIHNNVYIKDILHTSNSGVYMSSNVAIKFTSPSDSFMVSDVLKISSNYTIECDIRNMSIKNGSNNMMVLYDSNINMSNDVYVYNGTMYVNKISGIEGRALSIENAVYNSTSVDKMTASRNFTVISDTFDDTSLSIFKKQGNANIVSINSCNLDKTAVVNHLTINQNGQLGLGTPLPEATLSIKNPLTNNVIYYEGESYGDAFKVNKRGNIGIGTDQPNAQLHIRRNDDLQNNDFRKTSMMNIDMNYNALKNVSNLYTYDLLTALTQNNLYIYPYVNITSNMINSRLNVDIDNTFYVLTNEIYRSIGNDIRNISNIILPFPKTIELSTDPNIPTLPNPDSAFASINIINRLIYPASNMVHISVENAIMPRVDASDYECQYELILMSTETKNSGGYNNSEGIENNVNNFQNVPNVLNDYNIYSIEGYDIKYTVNFKIEKNVLSFGNIRTISYPFAYTKITPVQLEAPNFWDISYNSNFVSSLSSSGTLSLGHQVPKTEDGNFLLYAPGNAFLNSMNVSNISTDKYDANISFDNKNIINANKITCQNLQTQDLTLTNIAINKLTATYTDSREGNFSNIITSNINFHILKNDYMHISPQNAHFDTHCSIGNSQELPNNNNLKITIDQQIAPVSHNIDNKLFYTRHNALSIYNIANTNPCLSIQALHENTTPYLHMNNNGAGYYFRIVKKTTTTTFQIVTDDISVDNTVRKNHFITNNSEPHIFQHIKEYNVITLGEQDVICIDSAYKIAETDLSEPNSTNKVSIGVPYGSMTGLGPNVTYPQYFNDTIKASDNKYMLNIFGNVKIADVNDNPMFTAISVQENVYTAINTVPDNVHTLNVNGIIKAQDIKLQIGERLISLATFLQDNYPALFENT